MESRTALFGGTFDPIHNAHLEIARAATDQFHFKQVLFVPAFNPPHKERAKAGFADRLRMCEIACEDDPRFKASNIEEGSERSYSILTIEKLQEAGIGRMSFLIGADAFAEIQSWHRWRDVVRAVDFIVVTRPGWRYSVPEGVRARELEGLQLPVSSSEIRTALAEKRIDVPVPQPVLTYIQANHLYGT